MYIYMVQTTSSGYKVPELKYKKNEYPQSKNTVLPLLYWVGLFIGPRGGGKTYSVTQLIRAYEESPPINPDGTKQATRVFIISPTFEANEVFRSLKTLDEADVYHEYKPDVLEDILEKIKSAEEEIKEYKKKMELYKKIQKVKSKDIENLFKGNDALMDLFDGEDFNPPEPPRYPHGVSNFLIVDDMVGTNLLSGGKNPFTHLLLKNRHHRLCIAIMSQNLKSIPKAVRANASLWWMGKFGSPKALLEDMYEEVGSGSTTYEQFQEYYEAATDKQYGALVLDFSKPKQKRFSINFLEYIV